MPAWSSASWQRLRSRWSSRMLLLASVGSPGFLDLAPAGVDSIVMEALGRWGYAPRRWRLGEVAEATVPGDGDRLAVAIDALLENAVAHTDSGDHIELSARVEDGQTSSTWRVADSGCTASRKPTSSGSSAVVFPRDPLPEPGRWARFGLEGLPGLRRR